MTDTLNIVIADDHPIIIEGLRLLFRDNPFIHVLASASTYYELVNICSIHFPQLLILDINLGGDNSLFHIEDLRSLCPSMKIVIFSSYDNPGMVRNALKKGVNGYMLKDSSPDEWMDALNSMRSDQIYLSKSLGGVKDSWQKELIKSDKFLHLNNLSKQELRIIQAISEGLNEQEIANRMFISKNTVHTHKKNIMKKIDAHSSAEIVKFAYENQLAIPGI